MRTVLIISLLLMQTVAFAGNTDGRKTVTSGGTAEALGTGTFQSIDICAELNNTGIISAGFSPIASEATRTGIPLNAGDCWHYEPIDKRNADLAKIFIDTTVNGDGVTYTTYD